MVVFDDGYSKLSPLTDLRASFRVRTGAVTTLARLERQAGAAGLGRLAMVHVPERLAGVTREVLPIPVNELAAMGVDSHVLLMNGRCPRLPALLPKLKVNEAIVGKAGRSLLAAVCRRAEAAAYLDSGVMTPSWNVIEDAQAEVLERPWDVIRYRDTALEDDLADMLRLMPKAALPAGVVAVNEEAIRIGVGAKVSPGVVLDAEGGAIVIDEGAVVRPGSIIVGPAYIGKGTTILERGLIKAHTSIGPVCKVTGEVGGTIFQGYANKGHDGHLGDSWVGEWANFGAGTTNSNLLNTYGEVTAALALPGASRERTGLMYLGCIVGDHTKFAISTRIMTGSVFGTGCMVATVKPPPTSLAAFTWITDEREQEYKLGKFMDVAKTVMGRRKVTASEAYVGLLSQLHGRVGRG